MSSPWPSRTDSVTGEGEWGLEELPVGRMRPRAVDRTTALAGAPTPGRPPGWGGGSDGVGDAEMLSAVKTLSGGLRRGGPRT